MSKVNRLIVGLLASLLVGSAALAQTVDQLDDQYRATCSSAQTASVPGLKAQCEKIRSTLDGMRSGAAASKAQGPVESSRNTGLSGATPTLAQQVDNTAQCNCARKLGRCSANARVLGAEVTKLSTGNLSSRVVVRTDPPPGKCVEVTVFLQETAQLDERVARTGHPLYQVITGTNDVEWRNLSSPARRLEYSILSNDTECYVCDPDKGSRSGATAGNDSTASGNEVREAMEAEYRNCMAGIGPLFGQLEAATRRPLCADLRRQIDSERR